MTPRHAFLIIAHGDYDILEMEISLLDHERSDIYILIDKKSPMPSLPGPGKKMKGGLFFLKERIDIRWGASSQIKAEMLLFSAAHANGPYAYYHLLSGVDLPIKPIGTILSFFDGHQGKEFVEFSSIDSSNYLPRVMQWHFNTWQIRDPSYRWTRADRRRNSLERKANKYLKRPSEDFMKGCNWVSITEEFCSYLLQHKRHIRRRYRYTLAADEIFLHTLLWQSPFKDKIYSPDNDSSGSMREIDWTRGNPHVWGSAPEDLDILLSSGNMFARKFSSRFIETAKEIYARLRHYDEYCCGCTACESICPHGAITMKPDGMGFLYPSVDSSRCVDCGLCEKVCGFNRRIASEGAESNQQFYAIRHRDLDEIRRSRSGAAFPAVSDLIIRDGGVVYGAAFDSDFNVVHRRAATLEERDCFRGSKYVQSDMRGVFRQVRKDLSDGLTVLFSGTPCQVDGLRNYIGKRLSEKLYLADIVCHGVPAPAVWKGYLEHLEKKEGDKMTSADFRDKEKFGWSVMSECFTFSGGKKIYSDSFSCLFIKDLISRPACSVCPYADTRRPGDITFGDFWGWEHAVPGFNADDRGVSLVITSTEKGRRLLDAAKDRLEMIPVAKEQCLQPALCRPFPAEKESRRVEEDFKARGYDYISRKYGNTGWRYRLRTFARAVSRKLRLSR